jgi:hypothetical protein
MNFRNLMVAAVLAVPTMSFAAAAGDVIISEVVEGNAANYKWIELLNRTGSSIDLTADNVHLQRVTNGAATWTTINTTLGVIPAGGRIIIINNGIDYNTVHGSTPVGAIVDSDVNHNGNDSFRLLDNDTTTQIDSFAGDWLSAGSLANAAADGTYVRVLSAMPNNGNWGSAPGTQILDGASSPSGFWTRIAFTTTNGNAAAVTTPLGRTTTPVAEVPVSLSEFSAE